MSTGGSHSRMRSPTLRGSRNETLNALKSSPGNTHSKTTIGFGVVSLW